MLLRQSRLQRALMRSGDRMRDFALKPRQEVVLKLLCRGFENRHVAATSHMSESNVERVRKQLMTMTNSKNAVQLGVWAAKRGLV
jgi:DNA-binding NarL/FixJ family response regulator